MGSLWGHFLHMRVTFMAFRCHFEVTFTISTSNFMCDACVMHTCTGLVGPKRGNVKQLFVFEAFWKRSKRPRVIRSRLQGSEPSHFGVTFGVTLDAPWSKLWYVRVTLGHYRITLGSLWSHFWCLRSISKKHSFSQ